MEQLLTAITAKASSALAGSIPCYSVRAPINAPLPVCVVRPSLIRTDKATDGQCVSYYSVRFTVYATDGREVVRAIDDLSEAFDERPLPMDDGHECIRVTKAGASDVDEDDDSVIQGQVTFEVWIQTSIN